MEKKKSNPPLTYTDIGHSHPNDIIWMIVDQDLLTTYAGTFKTHEAVYVDLSIESHWRGRYERSTGFCSIAPPLHALSYRRPPSSLLDRLAAAFSVTKFYFFADGVEIISPNPKKKKALI